MNAIPRLSPAERAAVFVMLLSDEDAAALLAQLGPEELEAVGTAMCAMGDVDPGRIADAIAGFIAAAETSTLPARGREDRLQAVFARALGDVKAHSMMERIAPDAAPRSVEVARWLAPRVLVSLLEDEHPQVIALLLLMLETRQAAEILTMLPALLQPELVERIARLGAVSGDAVELLDSLLSARISQRFGAAVMNVGGAREAASLINLADAGVSRSVLAAIGQKDADLARAIEAEMFTFEMLAELDPMGMGRLLRDVENEVLVDALKGLDETGREPFFAAMSGRAADGLRDEIELRGKLRRADMLSAQQRIVEIARKLADDGEISLGAADGEFV